MTARGKPGRFHKKTQLENVLIRFHIRGRCYVYFLVLQWPASSQSDYDALIDMEDQLESTLTTSTSVDGHDFGSGEMNIFLLTEDPAASFADVAAALGASPRWADLRAAYREASGEDYEILWPPTLRGFSVT